MPLREAKWLGRPVIVMAAVLIMTPACARAGDSKQGTQSRRVIQGDKSGSSLEIGYGIWAGGSVDSVTAKRLILATGGTRKPIRLTPNPAFFNCLPDASGKFQCSPISSEKVENGVSACVAGNLGKDSVVTAVKVFIGVGCGPIMSSPQDVRLLPPPKGSGVVAGVAYRYEIPTHCGVVSAGPFDGRQWDADPPLSDGSGNPPKGFTDDENLSRGTITLLSPDRAEFSSESGMRAYFKPRLPGASDPQGGCE
ncbi:MAG: hypothetical protein ACR2FO_08105 [Actinomycetota bacterium]